MKKKDARTWEARSRWRITGAGTIALGPGKTDLLEAIERTGSISGGARAMNMSYRRAWLLVETMNGSFHKPLVVASKWRGDGAVLTEEGRLVLRLYRRLEARSLKAGGTILACLQSLLASGAAAPAGRRSRRPALRGRRSSAGRLRGG